MRACWPVVFFLSMASSWADDSASQLPKALLAYERPAFPAQLKGSAVVDGYATLAFSITADGTIDDAVVLEASHTGFGEAVLEVVPSWRFEKDTPANALPRREVLRFEFKEAGIVTSLSHQDAMKAAFLATEHRRLPIRTVSIAELAMPPARVSTFASRVKAPGSGKVAVSYVIDTEGRVRVPMIVSASRPELGLAALALIKEWRFSPPMHQNQPVLVEDSRTLNFGAGQ